MADSIRITHFINPHMFWFQYESSLLLGSDYFVLYEALQKIPPPSRLNSASYRPNVGDVIAVYQVPSKRWVRAVVDHIAEFPSGYKYFVWAIDCGMPLLVDDSKYIMKFPNDLPTPKENCVIFGGIADVIPATTSFDISKYDYAVMKDTSWSNSLIEEMDTIIQDAAVISFSPKLKIMSGQIFGDMQIITHANQIITSDELLLRRNLAIKDPDFVTYLNTMGTNRLDRWKTNNGETFVLRNLARNRAPTGTLLAAGCQFDRKNDDAIGQSGDLGFYEKVQENMSDWDERNRKFNNQNKSESQLELPLVEPKDQTKSHMARVEVFKASQKSENEKHSHASLAHSNAGKIQREKLHFEMRHDKGNHDNI